MECPSWGIPYAMSFVFLLYVHVQAAQKEVCPNLSPQMVGNGEKLRGVFTGQNYITYDIKVGGCGYGRCLMVGGRAFECLLACRPSWALWEA